MSRLLSNIPQIYFQYETDYQTFHKYIFSMKLIIKHSTNIYFQYETDYQTFHKYIFQYETAAHTSRMRIMRGGRVHAVCTR